MPNADLGVLSDLLISLEPITNASRRRSALAGHFGLESADIKEEATQASVPETARASKRKIGWTAGAGPARSKTGSGRQAIKIVRIPYKKDGPAPLGLGAEGC